MQAPWPSAAVHSNSRASTGVNPKFFLAHGSHLRHCNSDIGHYPMDLQWLPPDSCRFSLLHHVANTRRLTAVKLINDALPTGVVNSSAAAAVKYLSVDRYPPQHGLPNLMLLQILKWSFEVRSLNEVILCALLTLRMQTTPTFSQMPNLRILVLHKEYDFTTMPDLSGDTEALEKDIQESCRRCPNLVCIIHYLTDHWDAGAHRYTRFSISRDQFQGTGSALRVRREAVTVFKELFAPWWEIYDTA